MNKQINTWLLAGAESVNAMDLTSLNSLACKLSI